MERYYVDERVGCIAIRDRTLVDPEDSGLESDSPDVIKFWMGELVESWPCPTCGHSAEIHWTVKEEDKQAAEELCKQLNLDDVSQRID